MKRLISLILSAMIIMVSSPSFVYADNTEDTSLTSASVKTITVEGSRSGEISHPYPRSTFSWMLLSDERTTLRLPNEEKEKAVEHLREMTPDELEVYIASLAATLNSTGSRPSWEKNFLNMAVLSADYKDEYLEKQAVAMLYSYGVSYFGLKVRDDDSVYGQFTEIPGYCVFAYDVLYNSPYWDVLTEKYGSDSRALVEKWFKDMFDRVHRANVNTVASNYGGYWIKGMAGIAAVLNDPDRMRNVIEQLDTALCQAQYYGDGMWREGTFSYGQMMVGNCDEALHVIKMYKDPDDYVDTKFGLKLKYTDLSDRWAPRNTYLKNINGKMVYPNGSIMAVNDTHYTRGVTADTPIKENALENTELNHFGLYSLKYGNTDEAQQINLAYPSISEGLPYSAGHSHGDFLGLTLWSAGMELLPDGGYVFSPAVNRYLHMDTVVHNNAWVYSPKAVPYGSRGTRYTHPNTLAYDDGETNGKQIQLIDAECPQTDRDFIDMKRRTLFMVAVDENHSYTVDFQRLKGGTVHENFLRQVEEEDVTFETSLNLSEPSSKTLCAEIQAMGKKGGSIFTVSDKNFIKYPQIAETSDGFNFTWKGVDSGTSLKAFIKGCKDSTVAFSKFPTMRRVNNVEAVKDDYPGYHYYQRLDVTPEDITMFGGVYEGYRKDEEGNVKSVEWIAPADDDPLTQLVKVTLKDYTDYVYISDDLIPREFFGYVFAGNYAVVRINNETGKAEWKYLYGDGIIDINGDTFKGKKEYKYKVISASGMPDLKDVPNTLRVQGVLPKEAKGHWCHTIYGDGSGVAFEIKNVSTSVVTLNNTPGFTLTEKGARMETFPAYENPDTGSIMNNVFRYNDEWRRIIKGDVWFELKLPSFEVCQ